MKNFLLLSIITLLFSACNADYKQNGLTHSNEPPSQEDVNLDEVVINYGNGVYYFKKGPLPFETYLSIFIASHPGIEVVSFAPEPDGYSWAGYTVVFKGVYLSDETLIAKEKEEQSEENNVTE